VTTRRDPRTKCEVVELSHEPPERVDGFTLQPDFGCYLNPDVTYDPNSIYYVYIYYRYAWGYPFYVGEGHENRYQWLEDAVRRGKGDEPKHRAARKVFKKHGRLFVKKAAVDVSEADALLLEMVLIEIGRRHGWRLTNQNIGGKGNTNPSAEVRAKLSTAARTRHQCPEFRAKHSAGVRAAHQRSETHAKHSAGVRAAYERPEVRANVRAAQQRPEVRAKKSAAIRAAKQPPEVRAKISAASRASMQRPEVLANVSAASRAAWQRPEVRAKHSAAIRAAMQRPEVRAKLSTNSAMRRPEMRAKIIAAVQRPETRAKISASLKAYNARRRALEKVTPSPAEEPTSPLGIVDP